MLTCEICGNPTDMLCLAVDKMLCKPCHDKVPLEQHDPRLWVKGG